MTGVVLTRLQQLERLFGVALEPRIPRTGLAARLLLYEVTAGSVKQSPRRPLGFLGEL